MPRELAFHGVYMPIVTVMFLVAMVLSWALDRLMSGLDLYRFFWHPALLPLPGNMIRCWAFYPLGQ